MAVPKLASFDADGFRDRLDEKLGDLPVWDQFYEWKKSVDGLRDNTAAIDVQLNGADGIKKHLDRIDARESAHHAAQALRLAAIEAQLTQNPFPA